MSHKSKDMKVVILKPILVSTKFFRIFLPQPATIEVHQMAPQQDPGGGSSQIASKLHWNCHEWHPMAST